MLNYTRDSFGINQTYVIDWIQGIRFCSSNDTELYICPIIVHVSYVGNFLIVFNTNAFYLSVKEQNIGEMRYQNCTRYLSINCYLTCAFFFFRLNFVCWSDVTYFYVYCHLFIIIPFFVLPWKTSMS